MAKYGARDPWIIFVDTNIFLDFYRMTGEVASKQLAALERHTDKIILGDQVRMEFLKNRQRVILDGLSNISVPKRAQFPQIIADYEPAIMMNKRIAEAERYHARVSKKIEKVLTDPQQHDSVYKCFNRIFAANTTLNLRRPDKQRFEIRALARKRFALGYPPRKKSDVSFGDAINWEWIIRCAQVSPALANVVIVSRDGDYGVNVNKGAILNDWLAQEFKSRVSQKRKIRLTQRLSDALELLDESVTEAEKIEEEKIISTPPTTSGDSASLVGDIFRRYFEEMILQSQTRSEPSLGDLLLENMKETNDDPSDEQRG